MMVKKTADVSQQSFMICNTSNVTSSLTRRLVYERSVSNWWGRSNGKLLSTVSKSVRYYSETSEKFSILERWDSKTKVVVLLEPDGKARKLLRM